MARNAEQNQRMRDERRAQILSCALRLFTANGLAATRISDIAEAAGFSQGLLYHYYRSKEEIYSELIRGSFQRMNEACRVLEQLPLTPREKILKAITELVRLAESHGDFAYYFLLTAQANFAGTIPAEAAAVIRKQRREPYRALERILRAGQEDGSVRRYDAAELASVFWTLIKGLAMQRLSFGRSYRAPDPRILANIFLLEQDNEG